MKLCDHCKKQKAFINIKIVEDSAGAREEYRCKACYHVEQIIRGDVDWRQVAVDQYAGTQELTLKKGESIVNMINRNKIYLKKRGFLFGSEKTKSA